MAAWGTQQAKKKRPTIGTKKPSTLNMKRDDSLLSKKMMGEAINRAAASRQAPNPSAEVKLTRNHGVAENQPPKLTPQPSVTTTALSPTNTPIVDATGTVVGTQNGSSQPQAPDQASVTAAAIARRVGKPPKGTEHDEHPFPHGSPPKPAGGENYTSAVGSGGSQNYHVPNPVVARSRKKLARGFNKNNRLRRSFR